MTHSSETKKEETKRVIRNFSLYLDQEIWVQLGSNTG
jgi:hypothetical protein